MKMNQNRIRNTSPLDTKGVKKYKNIKYSERQQKKHIWIEKDFSRLYLNKCFIKFKKKTTNNKILSRTTNRTTFAGDILQFVITETNFSRCNLRNGRKKPDDEIQ